MEKVCLLFSLSCCFLYVFIFVTEFIMDSLIVLNFSRIFFFFWGRGSPPFIRGDSQIVTRYCFSSRIFIFPLCFTSYKQSQNFGYSCIGKRKDALIIMSIVEGGVNNSNKKAFFQVMKCYSLWMQSNHFLNLKGANKQNRGEKVWLEILSRW